MILHKNSHTDINYTVICPDYIDGVLQNLRDLITVI